MYTPHTVTLYTVEIDVDPVTQKETPINNITILLGVFLDASKGTNVIKSGLEGADAVTLYIPFSVEAVDGVTGETKQYIGPIEYNRMADKTGYWTLAANRNTFFVKGEVVEPDATQQQINMLYDNVYTISKVDEKDFGSPSMRHWEIGGV